MSKENSYNNIMISTLFILGATIIVSSVLEHFTITSLSFTISFFVVLITFFITAYHIKSDISILLLIITIILLAFINVLINSCLNVNCQFSFDYFKKYFMFVTTVIFFYIVVNNNVSDKVISFIYNIALMISIFLMIDYFVNKIGAYQINGILSQHLTFNFGNPNKAALFLVCIFLYDFIYMTTLNIKLIKLAFLIILSFMGYFIWQTGSRNCMIVLIAFILLYFYFVKIRKNAYHFKKWHLILIAVSPIAFALLYLGTIGNETILHIFNFMDSVGKGLNSRLGIWESAFEYIQSSPVFGAYSQISGGTGESQMHNTHVDIWASYGIFVLILTCVFLYKIMAKVNNGLVTKYQTTCLSAFFAIIIIGFGEAAMFSGGTAIYIFGGGFLLLAINGKRDYFDKKEKN